MEHCLNCGKALVKSARGRKAIFCGSSCRVAHHRKQKRYKIECNETSMKGQLILELFPGAGLFGKAFEALGATVVRGPDILWGGDVHDFHVPAGRFDGIIGGPPCQIFSTAAITGTEAVNLIPEFVRLIEEAKPKWAVMENVPGAVIAAPPWPYTLIRDFDCGGLTNRIRGFWFYGIAPVLKPVVRQGKAEHTVLATSWKKKSTEAFPGHEYLKAGDAGRLQGFPGLGETIMYAQPSYGANSGLSASSRNIMAVHMLGNGVPRAMGDYVAKHVMQQIQKSNTWDRLDLPPYPLFALAK